MKIGKTIHAFGGGNAFHFLNNFEKYTFSVLHEPIKNFLVIFFFLCGLFKLVRVGSGADT